MEKVLDSHHHLDLHRAVWWPGGTVLYIPKGKGPVCCMELDCVFQDTLTLYCALFCWQGFVPGLRLHTVIHSAQYFTWQMLAVCVLNDGKKQILHIDQF